MSASDLNSKDEQDLNLNYDLMKSLRNSRNFAWIVAIISIALLVVQGIFYALKPAQVIGVDENGNFVGTVVFGETKLRDEKDVMSDVKNVVLRCLSNSKETIWDDAAICLGHLEDELSDVWLASWEESEALIAIENSGCIRSEYEFNDVEDFERDGEFFQGVWSGTVSCNDSADVSSIKPDYFKVKITGKIIPKVEGNRFGIKIYEYDDEVN